MLPLIQRQAQRSFCRLPPEARAEAVQAVLAAALVAYARLVELGKASLAYPTVLSRYAIAHVRQGRAVGTPINSWDVLSPLAQRQRNFTVERLNRFDDVEQTWKDMLAEDGKTTPAELAASRIDFAAWLSSLSRRKRRIAQTLGTGETTSRTARRFRLTPGRISQIRSELHASWHRFQSFN
jgi:hypothetical protein